MSTYADALAALYALVPRGVVLGLEPMREALAARGDPQRQIPAIHVAGTNGKGSVAAMIDAALRAAGVRTGLYTSPHLHRFAERIRIEGRELDADWIARRVPAMLDAMARGELPELTFFEATTLLAWDAFADARVAMAVLEVGLGGRLDATNVCNPRVCAITRIARDHEALLGSTIVEIAREKAGILKAGVPCVLGPDLREGEAREAIEAVARAVGAPLVDAPRARVRTVGDGLRTQIAIDLPDGHPLEVDLALAGEHQVGNAAVAAGVLDALGVARDAIARGLASVTWPARLERIDGVLFDAAHNPDGALALQRALALIDVPHARRALVFGASADKDWPAMLELLAPGFEPAKRFYCAASLRRALEPARITARAPGVECAGPADALERARASVGLDGLVVVCGSIFVVAEARAALLGIASDPPVAM